MQEGAALRRKEKEPTDPANRMGPDIARARAWARPLWAFLVLTGADSSHASQVRPQ